MYVIIKGWSQQWHESRARCPARLSLISQKVGHNFRCSLNFPIRPLAKVGEEFLNLLANKSRAPSVDGEHPRPVRAVQG